MTPRPDFLRPQQRSRWPLWALAATLVLVATTAGLDGAATAPPEMVQASPARAQPDMQPTPGPLQQAQARLDRPWPAALAALDAASAPGIRWLALQIGDGGGLQLQGLAERRDAADTALRRLHPGPWRDPVLSRTDSGDGAALTFEIQADPLPTPPARAALPAAGDPAERVADLLALALRHGVTIVRTQQQQHRQGPVQQLQLTLVAAAGYEALRAFAAAALQADPAMALDRLQLRRANADAATVDAELQWSLWRADAGLPTTAATELQARAAWPRPGRVALAAWSPPQAPPPPPAAAAAVPPPPPFPYRWIGRLEDGPDTLALLAGPQRSLGARAGDVLDSRWRLERVEPGRLQLTWLPTGAGVAVEFR